MSSCISLDLTNSSRGRSEKNFCSGVGVKIWNISNVVKSITNQLVRLSSLEVTASSRRGPSCLQHYEQQEWFLHFWGSVCLQPCQLYNRCLWPSQLMSQFSDQRLCWSSDLEKHHDHPKLLHSTFNQWAWLMFLCRVWEHFSQLLCQLLLRFALELFCVLFPAFIFKSSFFSPVLLFFLLNVWNWLQK